MCLHCVVMIKMGNIQFDQYGNVWKTGITNNNSGPIHLNTNYTSNGMVFVTAKEDENDDIGLSWERMPLDKAIKENREIIECCYCKKHARISDV